MTQPTPPRGDPPNDGERAAPLATSGPGGVAAQFVAALSKAARSFTLYAPDNAVVRQFLADYQARAADATRGGELVLKVRPFDMFRDGELVYREEDRERSLAFRLFRDGVRRLSFRPGVPWTELLAFLEILAVRYVGIRQQEEDVVTLLRKGAFQGIGFTAVEGFTPDEDNPEPEGVRRRRGVGSRPPAGYDTPFPLLPPPGPIAWRAVPAEALASLRATEGPEALAADAIRLAAQLLAETSRGLVQARELRLFLVELRDYFAADAALGPLADLAELVGQTAPGELRDELLRTLGDERLLDALLAAVPAGAAQLPREALRLIPLVPAKAALDRLVAEADEGRRQALALIAEARLPADATAIIERLSTLDATVARALVHAIGAKAPRQAVQAAAALLDHHATSTSRWRRCRPWSRPRATSQCSGCCGCSTRRGRWSALAWPRCWRGAARRPRSSRSRRRCWGARSSPPRRPTRSARPWPGSIRGGRRLSSWSGSSRAVGF